MLNGYTVEGFVALEKRAKVIKLVAFDVDGVLTSGEITYTSAGDEIKSFNAKDGQGMNMLRVNGIKTAIITARKSPIVERRANDLGIAYVYQGAKKKLEALEEILNEEDLTFDQVAYVGDDLPDICCLEKVGLPCCPADAVDEVVEVAVFKSSKDGGRGAVREIADFILRSQHLI